MSRILLLALCGSAAVAQVDLAPPRRGVTAGDSGSLRPLLGVAGSLTAGAPLRGGVVSAASSGRFTLVKTHDTVEVLLDEETISVADAPEGRAIFAFTPGGAPGLAYFPATGGVMLWEGRAFRPAWSLNGVEVLAAAVRPHDIAAFAAAGEDGVRIETRRLRDGQLTAIETLAQARGPVLLGSDGAVVYWDGERLIANLAGSPPLEAPLPHPPAGFEQAGERLIVMQCGKWSFGLELVAGRARLFQLPAAPVEAGR